jgi:hypothetical protein
MARFETCARLLAHVNEPESHMRKFLLCPVSTCPLAVSQTPLQKNKSPLHFRKHQKRAEMTGNEIVQEIKPEQSSRCDLYDVIIQDAYIDMNWTENLNDKVIGRETTLSKRRQIFPVSKADTYQDMIRRMVPKMAQKTVWTRN